MIKMKRLKPNCLSYLLRASQYKSVQDNLNQQTLTKYSLCARLYVGAQRKTRTDPLSWGHKPVKAHRHAYVNSLFKANMQKRRNLFHF